MLGSYSNNLGAGAFDFFTALVGTAGQIKQQQIQADALRDQLKLQEDQRRRSAEMGARQYPVRRNSNLLPIIGISSAAVLTGILVLMITKRKRKK